MMGNSSELERAWKEPKLLEAWGPDKDALVKKAELLEEKDELFGGINTKVTVAGAEKEALDPSAAPTKESTASEKPLPAGIVKPVLKKPASIMAALVGAFGCPKCRACATGCMKCNPEKTAKWLAKKAAKEKTEAEEAKAEAKEKKAANKAAAKAKAKAKASKGIWGVVDLSVAAPAPATDSKEDATDEDDDDKKWEPAQDDAILEKNLDENEGDDVIDEGDLDEGVVEILSAAFEGAMEAAD